ncbi:hypothetical protein DOY81_005253 [Sarcophaga bullata]|nr:hypothetical protein DOY81_005253 [Sarcophaga bullata]
MDKSQRSGGVTSPTWGSSIETSASYSGIDISANKSSSASSSSTELSKSASSTKAWLNLEGVEDFSGLSTNEGAIRSCSTLTAASSGSRSDSLAVALYSSSKVSNSSSSSSRSSSGSTSTSSSSLSAAARLITLSYVASITSGSGASTGVMVEDSGGQTTICGVGVFFFGATVLIPASFLVRNTALAYSGFCTPLCGAVCGLCVEVFVGGGLCTVFGGGFGGAFETVFGGAFCGTFGGAFCGTFGGAFCGTFGGAFCTAFGGAFCGTFGGAFVGTFGGAFVGTFGGAFVGTLGGAFGATFGTTFGGTFGATLGGGGGGAAASAAAAFASSMALSLAIARALFIRASTSFGSFGCGGTVITSSGAALTGHTTLGATLSDMAAALLSGPLTVQQWVLWKEELPLYTLPPQMMHPPEYHEMPVVHIPLKALTDYIKAYKED